MGVEFATLAIQHGVGAILQNFNDEIVVKLRLFGSNGGYGGWLLMARVLISNIDGSSQAATAKLVHDADVIDAVVLTLSDDDEELFYLQAGYIAHGEDVITLECNTFDGVAQYGSILAMTVDNIIF
jgi:hypothetical protein